MVTNYMTRMTRDEAAGCLRMLIQFIGENPEREGLKETPWRILKAWEELFSGYYKKPEELLKLFDHQSETKCDEMIVVKNIDFVSWCEHHWLPFQGVAHVGYIPKNGKIIGLSNIPRVVDAYAKRLQVQENLTAQIADCLMTLDLPGCGAVVESHHSCMSCRGVKKQEATMVTSALRGCFKDDPSTRSEFLQLIRSKS